MPLEAPPKGEARRSICGVSERRGAYGRVCPGCPIGGPVILRGIKPARPAGRLSEERTRVAFDRLIVLCPAAMTWLKAFLVLVRRTGLKNSPIVPDNRPRTTYCRASPAQKPSRNNNNTHGSSARGWALRGVMR